MIFRWFIREWKTPSLIIVWLAMSLSVAAILALGSLGDRLEQRLNIYSKEFMAGDLVLRSTRPAQEEWLQKAYSFDLEISRQLSFQTMAFVALADESIPYDPLEAAPPLLVSVKATDNLYPLYGELVTEPLGLTVQQGGVLVAEDILIKLNLSIGDQLEIGDATFSIIGKIVKEPDAGFSGIQSAPKVLMHIDDIDKTGAVQLGSRLTYRYMLAGEKTQVDRFYDYLKPILPATYRFVGEGDSGSGVNRTVDRARQFLILCSILTLLLSGSAVMVAMTHYTKTRYQLVAVLKTMGATHKTLRRWIVGQWVMLLILSIATGGLLGIATEQGLIYVLRNVLPKDLPEASFKPWIWAAVSLIIMAFLVGLRPYLQLLVTPPIRVLRQTTLKPFIPLKIYLPGITLFSIGLLFSLVGFNKIVWSVLLGIGFLAALLGLVGWLLLKLLRSIKSTFLPFRLAVNRLLHQPRITFSQLSAFSLSFMLLSLLIAMQSDLLDRWQAQLPKDTPSYILMNINEGQKNQIDEFWNNQDIVTSRDYFTIVLARITELNGVEIKSALGEKAQRAEALNREINLTQLNTLPETNELIAGTWPPKPGETSIEQSVAEQIGISLGDSLTFDSGGRIFNAKVTSIRKVDWESLQLNFYFIFPEGQLDAYTKMWITPLIFDDKYGASSENATNVTANEDANASSKVRMMAEFSRTFPSVSVLDVSALVTLAGNIISQISGALQFMAALVILCGVLLMFAQVQVSMRQRHIELVVYKTLGASRSILNKTIWIEFLILGLVAGLVAILGAEVALWGLHVYVFDFPWTPNFKLWLFTPIASSGLLVLCGWLLSRKLVNYQSNLRALNQ
ncbi:putative ABC transporter permease subunit YbbP [Thorsellia kenyensis]|uniref:ABC transporter permease subunit YbbP n=1 Tax=Thorsellia kenyensis TaxID=1549888 RepID=A0ABV6CDC6_9GAMM